MRKNLLAVSLLLLLVIYSFIVTSCSSPGATVKARHQAQIKQNPGLPAIVINTSSNTTSVPRFTISDVRAYLSKNKQPYIEAPTVSGKPPAIRSIEFITNKETSIRTHGEATGLTDSALVYYVEMYGPFDMSKVVTPPHRASLPIMNNVVEIFDAQTGNLLMTWAHN